MGNSILSAVRSSNIRCVSTGVVTEQETLLVFYDLHCVPPRYLKSVDVHGRFCNAARPIMISEVPSGYGNAGDGADVDGCEYRQIE